MQVIPDLRGSTPFHLPCEALDAAAPLRGCALMQAANARVCPIMPRLYSKQQPILREVLARTGSTQEIRGSSPGERRPFPKRVLSGVDAQVKGQSQGAQEMREWVHKLSRPVTGSFGWGTPVCNFLIAKRKPQDDNLENGRTRKRVLPAPPTPPAGLPHELAKQCRRLYAAMVRVSVSEDGNTSNLDDLGLLDVSIERWNEDSKVRTSVVARDHHGDVRMTFSLIKCRRTSVIDGPSSTDFGVATKGDRRGSTWQAVVFRLECSEARKRLQGALESFGTEEVSVERVFSTRHCK